MTYVLPNGPFTVRMDHQAVQVVNILPDDVPKASWWLIREYCLNWTNKSNFNSILLDNDGLSIICGPERLITLQSLNIENIRISPQRWVSLIINVIGSANELPGVIFYLANALSKEGLSILHISTFDSEVFLVQEQDVDRACDILRTIGNLKDYSDSLDRNNYSNTQQRSLFNNDTISSLNSTMVTNNNTTATTTSITMSNHHLSSSSLSSISMNGSTTTNPTNPTNPTISTSCTKEVPLHMKEGFTLKVLPDHVMLTKLNTEFYTMDQCAPILMKLLLYDPRYSSLERLALRTRSNGLKRPSQYTATTTMGSSMNTPSTTIFNTHFTVSTSATATTSTTATTTATAATTNSVNSDGWNMLNGSSLHYSNGSTSYSDDSNGMMRSGVTTTAAVTTSMNISTPSSFMWGMWQCGDEITFLLDENDVSQFPQGALNVSPQHWRIVKLSGRAIDFDETGVVSAMSQVESGIPALNISTATTNCTLVPDELLHTTLDALAATMKIPIDDSEDQLRHG